MATETDTGLDPRGRDPRKADYRPALRLVAAYLVFRSAAVLVELPERTPVPVLGLVFALTALASIGLPIAAISALVRQSPSPRWALAAALGGLLLWLGLAFAAPWMPRPAAPFSLVVQDAGKILAAAGIGTALAAAIREPNLLFPAGLFAAFADFVVVNFGTVKQSLAPGNEKGQALVKAISAEVPALHSSLPVLTIGPADFLFLGIFLACAARFGMGLGRTAWLLAVVLAGSLVLVPFVGSIPALAPMALAFVAVNYRWFRLTRQEALSTVLVLVIAGVLFAGYFVYLFPGAAK